MPSKPKKAPAKAKPMPAPARGLSLGVSNFGPIAEGQLDVRPLTVFAGPSNTGKSWMATLIYVLGDYLRKLPQRFWGRPEVLVPENPQNWEASLGTENLVNLTDSDRAKLSSAIEASVDAALVSEFLRCRGLLSSSELTRTQAAGKMLASFRYGLVAGRLKPENFQIEFPRQLNLSDEQARCLAEYVAALLAKRQPSGDPHGDLPRQLLLQSLVRAMLGDSLVEFDAGPGGTFFYLPAGRGTLTHTLQTLTSGLIWRASRRGSPLGDHTPRLTGVAGDFLERLQLTAKQAERKQAETGIVRKLEKEILRGEVKVEQSEVGVPIFNFHPTGWKGKHLPLMSASSTVSELAPVALFLRYWVSPGDTLILEEPEAHLHPAAQMRLTEEIAAWVKAGIRVIITTHSEWMVEVISNMVYRSQVKESDRKGKPALAKEEVGVWLFDFINPDKPEKGTRIKEIPWDLDEAGYEAGFYDAAMKVGNGWSESWNCLANGSEAK